MSQRGLRNERTTLFERALLLRHLVHLVGDMQQPLHMLQTFYPLFGTTLGGNNIQVRFSDEIPFCKRKSRENGSSLCFSRNLYALWDSGAFLCIDERSPIFSFTTLESTDRAIQILNKFSKKLIPKCLAKIEKMINMERINKLLKESRSITSWGADTSSIAIDLAYKPLDDQILALTNTSQEIIIDNTYFESVCKVSAEQIYLAGIRLADMLNSIFDENYTK